MSRLQMDMRIFNKHIKCHSVQRKLKIKGKKYFFFSSKTNNFPQSPQFKKKRIVGNAVHC